MKTSQYDSHSNSSKRKKKFWIDVTSLVSWITVIAVITMFWMGFTALWEGNYISHAIAKLFHTTVSHLAKQ